MSGGVSFSEIKSRVSIEQVLRCYGVDWLRGSGVQQYRGRCPIHQGQGAEAFHVNFQRNVFHCFACGAGGNVLDLVAAMESCSIREAALRLGGLQVSGGAAAQSGQRQLVTKKRTVHNSALGFSLSLDRRHPYVAGRGIDAVTADWFGVGYYAAAGLMSGRVAIPIHDTCGRLVAYCGRAIDGSAPRYRFPAGFQKSQVLFNYHRAVEAGCDRLIVVEGFFDCMRIHQAGFPGVVALMGARLSEAQRVLLTDRFSNIILMLDGDPTGRRAAAQIARELAPELIVTDVHLPENMQPDQMEAGQIRQVLAAMERRVRPSDQQSKC
jgi:DNA primase